MRLSSRRFHPAVLVLGVAAPALLVVSACLVRVDAQPQHPGPAPGELSGKYFKNIKVLKNLPANKLIPVMQEWDAALGVRCDFCHVDRPDHSGKELDDKPTKNTARSMLAMTMDLNKKVKIVNNRVTCYLCHHGHPDPESHPGAEGGPRGPGPGR